RSIGEAPRGRRHGGSGRRDTARSGDCRHAHARLRGAWTRCSTRASAGHGARGTASAGDARGCAVQLHAAARGRAESTLRSAPTATRPASFSAPAASATTAIAEDVTLDEGTANAWRQTIARVNERKRMLGAFLEEIQLVGVAGDALVLAMDDLHRSVIDSSEHRPIVHEELARAFGRPVVFRCTA